jgi:hypothetical protein
MRLYIAVLEDVPDFIVPTLVAHTMLGAHLQFSRTYIAHEDSKDEIYDLMCNYVDWLEHSFKKCVIRVNKKEFEKIAALPHTYLGHENTTLGGIKSCAIPVPIKNDQLPNVLKFSKLWAPIK